jgi:hypothetical protein
MDVLIPRLRSLECERILRFAVALLVALALTAAGGAHVSAQTGAAPDFAIPAGWFYTQALPSETDGEGFAVQDGHGADLWTAFQAAGGVPELGYPTSRRFEWDGWVAQAFSSGTVLRWNPLENQTESLSARSLPGGRPPAYAATPDHPPWASGEADPTPWSGWWWPANGTAPALFTPGGPLDKYDRYVAAETGIDPQTRLWERQNVYYPGIPWAGHCNGLAAAALLEPEPTVASEVDGLTFSIADLKGLLVDYDFGGAAAWSFGDSDDLNPMDFHRVLLDWLANRHSGFVLTFDRGGGEVWSYPVYRFTTEWAPDAAQDELWHVTTTLWMADINVPPDFVGTKVYPNERGEVFTYDLIGDPRSPSDGNWTGDGQTGRSAHPARIWYPDSVLRNQTRPLVSPGLDRTMIDRILAGGDTAGVPQVAIGNPRGRFRIS